MGRQLVRFLLAMTALYLLTACSEMRVIGNAALREFQADGINAEQLSYRSHSKATVASVK